MISRSAGIARVDGFDVAAGYPLVIARSFGCCCRRGGLPESGKSEDRLLSIWRVDACPSCGDTRAEFASDKTQDTGAGNTKKEIVCSRKDKGAPGFAVAVQK